MKILLTGGAGFIGSAVIRHLIKNTSHEVLNLDKLTYAANLQSLAEVTASSRYHFSQTCISDEVEVTNILNSFQPEVIMHLAAESHVDRSIENPKEFINTNILGTFNLLNASYHYWKNLPPPKQETFRFHHISTDEVYGDLSQDSTALFTESTAYAPSSPYSASKAASDHLVRAWHRTYGLPTLITHSSNSYGPFQFPEKLIPQTITQALAGKPIPIYGDGTQIRDWLFVDDHAKVITTVIEKSSPGETYNIGGNNEKKNIEVVNFICDLLEEFAADLKPLGIKAYKDLITFVTDRPGHDTRYAIDASKIRRHLGWKPVETFETGLRKTVLWHLDNHAGWKSSLN